MTITIIVEVVVSVTIIIIITSCIYLAPLSIDDASIDDAEQLCVKKLLEVPT